MPFVPDNQLTPEQVRHDQVMTFLRSLRTESETTMATLNEDLTRYFGDVDTQFQQIKDGLQARIDALTALNDGLETKNADLTAEVEALQGLQTEVDTAQTRLGEKQAELEADDPAPDPAPAGDEPA